MAKLVPIVVLLIAALSGCAANDGGGAKDQPGSAPAPEANIARVSDTTGGIEGFVVDDSIQPIPNAQVGIQDPAVSTVTDAAGAFSFSELPPGRYSVFAQALGFESKGTAVDVVAGEVAHAQFTLAATAVANPYPETVTFAGLIECGWGLTGAGTGNCVPIQFIIDQFDLPNPTNTRTTGQYVVANPPNAKMGVFEMQWDPSTATTASELRLLVEAEDAGAVGGTGYGDESGKSPLRVVVDATPFEDLVKNGNQKIQTRTFPAAALPPTTVLNQRFTVYATVCYNAECDPDFTALVDR